LIIEKKRSSDRADSEDEIDLQINMLVTQENTKDKRESLMDVEMSESMRDKGNRGTMTDENFVSGVSKKIDVKHLHDIGAYLNADLEESKENSRRLTFRRDDLKDKECLVNMADSFRDKRFQSKYMQ
jgi:hypothetical protein